MKLHTVFISYNRLELTKRAIASYLETVTVPFELMVVDNCSTDDATIGWLMRQDYRVVVLDKNYYPGFAANYGWNNLAYLDGTHFQRADNDFIFLPGWCEEVERMFRNRKLGQLGLRTDEEELFQKTNVGGNNIIRRELWDQGLRYDERTWMQLRGSEDTLFSQLVRKKHWEWDRVEKPCVVNIDGKDVCQQCGYKIDSMAFHPGQICPKCGKAGRDPGDLYYERSLGDRGITWT